MAEVSSNYVEIDGIRTRVLTSGPDAAKEAVVLIHGAPGSADVWGDLQPRLGDVARTVAFDLPGYGHADRPETFPHTPVAYTSFIGSAIVDLGIRRAHLVMNDIGGFALRWAADNPDMFVSSTQINTGIINQMRRWHVVGVLYRVPVTRTIAERFGGQFLGPTLWYYDVLPAEARKRLAAGFDRGQRRALGHMYRSTPIDVGSELSPRLAALDRPALVIWGARDRFVPMNQADQRVAFPNAQVEVLDRSGHYPHLDDPETVADLVVPFIRGQIGS
ncbi:alpha/beta hydrolase [Mycolicibacterium conceptionense]|uniref:Alpha/beta hydrolase n=1 Tax=Mycolicibacterium conceptionense TaxID=451644 RepID=A0A0U1DHJ3_9MYCO|nr:alpha/beta fold hydrolase [Mycolicibacterium conceptionense]ORV24666.1 hypothetical protein AWB98_20740 [Mycolicibacterium conceptionense]CQD16713.1 alpha/beta hydrolase [Mycolicibacterium conceptionense]